MLSLPCQKTVLIQRETVSHSITCSMCAFQVFMHSGFWAGPIFHTHPHLQHSSHCLSKHDCTGSVWHLCVCMFYMCLYNVCLVSLYLRDISQSISWGTCHVVGLQFSTVPTIDLGEMEYVQVFRVHVSLIKALLNEKKGHLKVLVVGNPDYKRFQEDFNLLFSLL